jgi:hypothetical protein
MVFKTECGPTSGTNHGGYRPANLVTTNAAFGRGEMQRADGLKEVTELLQVRDYKEDDWTGLSDLQARRKRQN